MAFLKANCRKVVCIGRNYADHITELSSARPSQPFFFLKPSTSILPPPHTQTPILRPAGTTLHYETELGLVISPVPSSPHTTTDPHTNLAQLKNLPDHPSVLQHVSSYLLALDMTARNAQNEAKTKGLPWSISKGFDTFLPISSPIPPAQIPNPHAITLFMDVNDEPTPRQRDSTELMLFQLPRLLSDISKVMALEEGDIVITGTPKGVGPVVPGDVMRAGIEVDGKVLEGSRIEIRVEEAPGADAGAYVYRET